MSSAGRSTFLPPEKRGTITVERFPAGVGGAPLAMPLTGGMTLDELLESLAISGDTEAVLVNGTYVRPDYRLQIGDRVMIIPFMSGG
jgi:sulfur carrier protein ThiS